MLRLLAAVLGYLPLPVFVFAPGSHFGDVHQHLEVDDECDCGDCDADPDGPQPVVVVMPIASAADLFAEAGIRCRNGGDPEAVGWEMARTLELGDIEP
jgi:hypothetical protein